MFRKINPILSFIAASLLLIGISTTSCNDDDETAPNSSNNPTDTILVDTIPVDTILVDTIISTPSQYGLLVGHIWELYQTFENGVEVNPGLSANFKFTSDGNFDTEITHNIWSTFGTYTFSNDSTAINVIFSGAPNVVRQELTLLNDVELHTEFTIGSIDFLYKYRR